LQPVGAAVQPRISVHCAGEALQVTVLQVASGPQVTPQAQDEPQLTLLHEFRPLQSTLHAPRPHATLRQLPRALQLILQDVLFWQLTPAVHAFSTEHSTLQAQPAGHAI
jgi:methionyl-tRNA formyltransferase